MSDMRIGIISEGRLDQDLIRQIICAEFPERTFLFINISPSEDEIGSGKKGEGFGWGGVYKVSKLLKDKLEILQMTGIKPDLLIIHIDGDVMMVTYESARIKKMPSDRILPCYRSELSTEDNCRELMGVAESWGYDRIGPKIYCIPHINSDVWTAYAFYEEDRKSITQEVSKKELEEYLLRRSKTEGRIIRMHQGCIQKKTTAYKEAIAVITTELLQEMKHQFSLLDAFCSELSSQINAGTE